MKITPELLIAAVGCSRDRAERFAPYLDAACAHYQIDSSARLAAFLAQIGHESGSLHYVRELADGSAYEGRKDLGNTQPGDGKRYRGRGLIQITGRDNYRQLALRMQALDAPDFADFPESLEEARWAAWSAADWWHSRGLNGLADVGEFDQITRKINGGTNGAADRLARWERAQQALATHASTATDKPAAADHRSAYPASEWDMNNPPSPVDTSAEHVKKPAENVHIPTEWELQNPAAPEQPKASMAPFVIPAVLELAKLIPRLGSMFGGSEVAQRNVAAASVVVDAVVGAVGASNAQEAVEKIQVDPVAREVATKAVDSVWPQISEAGSGGIAGARKADAERSQAGDMLHSASFWVAMLLLPLVYLLVLSLIGLVGTATWSDDVRAGLSGSLISAIVGGLVGYYYGQTTSRNRSPS